MKIEFTNIREFERNLQRFAKKTKLDVQIVIDKTALDLFGDIITRTPVRTGYARANWFLNPNVPNTDVLPKPEKDKIIDAEKYNKQQENNIGNATKYYITNNVPYIVRLEEGISKQAGKGHMVKRAISLANQRIKAALDAIT